MRLLCSLLLLLALTSCAGEEKSPQPYYATPGGAGGTSAGGSGPGGGAGGSSSGGTSSGGSGTGGAPSGALVINEIDPSGDPVDWVEVKNQSGQPLDASGWVIAQKFEEGKAPADDDKLVIPAGTTLQPGERLVLHTRLSDGPGPGDFGIGKDAAERITLLDPNGNVIDDTTTDGSAENPFPKGTSWARLPDGEGSFVRAPSTKGTTNAP
ncbi:MAG: lamin tail domain-containing protein [Myxococcales bacterium]|nr:lamin tail domain-containing protein [Polyangiaceae bacterium]MDW8247811.1 lamin tail domain-containing protein [Myxococcales bacterium]